MNSFNLIKICKQTQQRFKYLQPDSLRNDSHMLYKLRGLQSEKLYQKHRHSKHKCKSIYMKHTYQNKEEMKQEQNPGS